MSLQRIIVLFLVTILAMPFFALHFVNSTEDAKELTGIMDDFSEEEEEIGGEDSSKEESRKEKEKEKSNSEEKLINGDHFYANSHFHRRTELTQFQFDELNLISKEIHLDNSTPPPEFV